MTSKQRQPKQYFYSPDLDECANCGQHMNYVRGVGTVILEAGGHPLMYYALCNDCAPHLNSKEPDFVKRVEQRLVARAEKLGAYRSSGNGSKTVWAQARGLK